MGKQLILAYIKGRWGSGNVSVEALAEDGHVLGGHISSSVAFGKRDIGYLPGTFLERRHEQFKQHYPDGFEVVWIDSPESDERYIAAVKRNHALPK